MAKAKQLSKRIPWRTEFNPDREFVVIRALPSFGLQRGEPFDKGLVTQRRLRQLFDQRIVHYPGEQPGAFTEVARRRRRAPEGFVHSEIPSEQQPAEEAGQSGPACAAHPAAAYDPEIPPNWRELPWNARRALAARIDHAARTGPEVAAAIEAELQRRGLA